MTKALLILLASLALALMLALWRLDTVIVQRDTARQDASVNAAALVLAEASRTTEQARQGVADAEGAVGYEQIEQARRDADAAGAAAGRLRVEAGRIATQLATCNASTAGERQARVATGDLLADVLGRADDRAGELAAIADRARAAGLTCERVYDGVSGL